MKKKLLQTKNTYVVQKAEAVRRATENVPSATILRTERECLELKLGRYMIKADEDESSYREGMASATWAKSSGEYCTRKNP
jgi:hypothetical protein